MILRVMITIILILMNSCAFAQKEAGCTLPMNEKYSFKDFSGKSLKDVPVEELNNTCIKGSAFPFEILLDEQPVSFDIFPDGMKNVEFVRCNLTNVFIPIGNVVSADSQQDLVAMQNDHENWKLDKITKKPIEPAEKEKFIIEGKSLDPKDIPKVAIDKKEVISDEIISPAVP